MCGRRDGALSAPPRQATDAGDQIVGGEWLSQHGIRSFTLYRLRHPISGLDEGDRELPLELPDRRALFVADAITIQENQTEWSRRRCFGCSGMVLRCHDLKALLFEYPGD